VLSRPVTLRYALPRAGAYALPEGNVARCPSLHRTPASRQGE